MTSTRKHPAPAGQPATTKTTAPSVEFSHLEKVSPRDSESPTTPPTTTPFLV